jgi:hypothetical protein
MRPGCGCGFGSVVSSTCIMVEWIPSTIPTSGDMASCMRLFWHKGWLVFGVWSADPGGRGSGGCWSGRGAVPSGRDGGSAGFSSRARPYMSLQLPYFVLGCSTNAHIRYPPVQANGAIRRLYFLPTERLTNLARAVARGTEHDHVHSISVLT